jgi:hypothetical protein
MALRAAYALDAGSGTTGTDASGNGFTATVSGWNASGHTNAAASDVSYSGSALISSPTAWTVMCWAKPITHAAGDTVFALANDAAASSYWFECDWADSTHLQIDIQAPGHGNQTGTASTTTSTGTWVHVAMTWTSSTGAVTLYLNGTSVASLTASGSFTAPSFFTAGSWDFYGNSNATLIDDFRIFDTALTSTDINTWASTPVVVSAVPVITTPVLYGVYTGTAFSQTLAATNSPTSWTKTAGSYPTGLSLNTSTGAITGTPTDAAGTSYSFTVKATNGSGDSTTVTYSGTVTTKPAPLVQWAADAGSGTTAVDSSGNGFNGSVPSGAWTTGHSPHTSAAEGDSTHPAIMLEGTTLFSGSKTATLMCWVNPINLTGSGDLIEVKSAHTGGTALTIYRPSSTTLQAEFDDTNGSTTDTTQATTGGLTGQWHHVAVTLSATTLTLYLDGVQVATNSVAGTGTLGAVSLFYAGGTDTKFNQGAVNDVRLFSSTLTQNDVYYYMNTVSGTFANGTGAGSVALTGAATAKGGATAPGAVTMVGAATGKGSTTVPGSVAITGSATARANATAAGPIAITGSATGLAGGTALAAGTITITGAATGTAAATAAGSIAVAGAGAGQGSATAGGSLAVSGAATAAPSTGASAAGAITIVGAATGYASATAGASTALTGTATASARATAGGAVSVTGSATSGVPSATTLIAAYACDEGTGTTAADATGNGHTAVVNSWGAGHTLLGAVGDLSHAALRYSGPLITSPDKLTAMAWYKPNVTDNQADIITVYQASLATYTGAYWSGANEVKVFVGDSVGFVESAPVTDISKTDWSHIAVVLDESAATLYVNGVQKASVSHTGTLGDIGGYSVGGNSKFNAGTYDDVRLFSGAMSAGDITSWMNTPVVEASAGTTFTITGAATGVEGRVAAGTITITGAATAQATATAHGVINLGGLGVYSGTPQLFTYGNISGRIVDLPGDTGSDDVDFNPDAVGASGSITFTPSPSTQYCSLRGVSEFVSFQPITVTLDSDGYLAYGGQRGVYLVASDSPGVPTTIIYHASFAIAGANIPGFDFILPTNGALDITTMPRL